MRRRETARQRGKRGKRVRHDRPGRAFTWRRDWTRENQMRYTLRLKAGKDLPPIELVLLVPRHPFDPKHIATELRALRNQVRKIRATHAPTIP